MVYFLKAGWFFLGFILLFILSSCAQMKSTVVPQVSNQTLSQAQQHVRAGEYQKTIDLYKTEYKENPQDPALVKEYVKNLEEINTAADRASGREDFASAGKTYSILLKNYPDFKRFAGMLSFDSAVLNSNLTNCKTALSKKGFQAYREGNLSKAISLWQDYLEIDPNNTAIRKTLNTAKIQQKNLQQTK
jgi:tetratricopeptide (TPR) repeat protein